MTFDGLAGSVFIHLANMRELLGALDLNRFQMISQPTNLCFFESKQPKIKTQLLSQRPVAGVGNIYADEACFRAGIYPGVRKLTKAKTAALHESIRYVLTMAVANGGTTLRDYVNAEGSKATTSFISNAMEGMESRASSVVRYSDVW